MFDFSRREIAGIAAGAGAFTVLSASPAAAQSVDPPLPWFDVRADWGGPGAVGNGTADDTPAIQRAVDAASDAQFGGCVVVPPGRFRITDAISFPSGKHIDIIGAGRQQTRFLCDAAAAGLRFGMLGGTEGSQGSTSGGFWIDGTDVASVGMNVSESNNRRFVDIAVSRCGVGLAVEGAQNGQYDKIVARECGEGVVFDWGAGGNLISAMQVWGCDTNIVFQNSWDGAGSAPSNYGGRPTNNIFIGGQVEGPTGSIKLDHRAGQYNYFIGTGFAGSGTKVRYHHQLSTAGRWGSYDLAFHACNFFGGTAIHHSAAGAKVRLVDCRFHTVDTAFLLANRCYVWLDAYNAVDVTTRFANESGGTDSEESLIGRESFHRHNVTVPEESGIALRTWVGTGPGGGRESRSRFQLDAAGTMGWSSGVTEADTTLSRVEPGVLRINGILLTDGGVGVGNSEQASSLGSVVKKVQIFDSDGNSLGYVPVYDDIS